MISEKENIKTSKFLSLVLRHQPELIGLKLDENGWVNVDELIKKTNNHGIRLDLETLDFIVNTNNKKRFAFNETLDKISSVHPEGFILTKVVVEIGGTKYKFSVFNSKKWAKEIDNQKRLFMKDQN